MKLRISAGLFLAATLAVALWDARPSEGQSADQPVTAAPAATYAPPSSPTAPAAGAPGQPAEPAKNFFYSVSDEPANVPRPLGKTLIAVHSKPGSRQVEQVLRQAAAALRDAKDDAAKSAAQTQLTELLNNYFEEDMRRREQELASVEARLKDLQEQAARRREKKSEIVDLQIKVLLNEADGLGFFSESMSKNSALNTAPQALERRTWITTDDLYAPRTGQAASVAPAGTPTADIPAIQPLGVQPSPK